MIFHVLTEERQELVDAFFNEFDKALREDCKHMGRPMILPYVIETSGSYSGNPEYYEKFDSFVLDFAKAVTGLLSEKGINLGAAAVKRAQRKAKQRQSSPAGEH